jgi:hypothetical protein
MSAVAEPILPVDTLWTIDDVCRFFRVRNRATVKRWIKAGRIPQPLRIGNAPLWNPDAVRAAAGQTQSDYATETPR